MQSVMRKKGILMSLFMGAIMGLVFTVFAQLKNQGRIMLIGVVIGIIISIIISIFIGFIIPLRKVNGAVCKALNIPAEKRLAVALADAFVFNLIFTPPNCCINMWYGMAMGLADVPATVTNIFQKMIFCAGLPYFVPALISTLLIDLVIGFFLTFLVSPLINKLTNKMCGISE